MVKEKLSYESHEPAFLLRLKGHYDTVEERPPQDIARIRKSRRNDDADDEPTILDENGETVTKEAFGQRQTAASGDPSQADAVVPKSNDSGETGLQTREASRKAVTDVVNLAPSAKRKVARVIANEDAREDATAPSQSQPAEKISSTGTKSGGKKKTKRPKLSFEDN